jgi:hypothetical protein
MGIYYRQNCIRMMIVEHNKIHTRLKNFMVATGSLLSSGQRKRQVHLDQLIRVGMSGG